MRHRYSSGFIVALDHTMKSQKLNTRKYIYIFAGATAEEIPKATRAQIYGIYKIITMEKTISIVFKDF
jgi:hypothetical protein